MLVRENTGQNAGAQLPTSTINKYYIKQKNKYKIIYQSYSRITSTILTETCKQWLANSIIE